MFLARNASFAKFVWLRRNEKRDIFGDGLHSLPRYWMERVAGGIYTIYYMGFFIA